MKDVKELLADLHLKLTERLLTELEEGLPDANTVRQIREFLRDNRITAEPGNRKLSAVEALYGDLSEDELPY